MKLTLTMIALALFGANAFATSTRTVTADQLQTPDLSKTFSFPAASDTLVGRVSTDTLTGKTMSGASNTFSAIPVGAIGNGSVLSGTNTGDVTAAAFGSSPNANGFSLSGQVFTMQPADATHPGGLLSADWNTFNNKLTSALTTNHLFIGVGGVATDTAVSGDLSNVAGAFTIANLAVTAAKMSSGAATAGQVATADGAGNVSYASPSSPAPVLTGSRGSPSNITAAGGIAFTGSNYNNIWFIQGNAGAVTITANPQIAAGSAVGQVLKLVGRSNTNTVTIADGTGLSLNGGWVAQADSVMELLWDGTNWSEISRR